MDLYLIRHADALPSGGQGITDDADRPLSPKGVQQVKALAVVLDRMDMRLGTIVSSPLLRAMQTAEEIVRNAKTMKPEIVLSEDLAFGGRRRRLARFVDKLGGGSIALVGHQPEMGELAGWLIGSRAADIEFAKAAVAYIRCGTTMGKGAGSLVWLTTPDLYMKST